MVKRELSWKAKLWIYCLSFFLTLNCGSELLEDRTKLWIQTAEIGVLDSVAWDRNFPTNLHDFLSPWPQPLKIDGWMLYPPITSSNNTPNGKIAKSCRELFMIPRWWLLMTVWSSIRMLHGGVDISSEYSCAILADVCFILFHERQGELYSDWMTLWRKHTCLKLLMNKRNLLKDTGSLLLWRWSQNDDEFRWLILIFHALCVCFIIPLTWHCPEAPF